MNIADPELDRMLTDTRKQMNRSDFRKFNRRIRKARRERARLLDGSSRIGQRLKLASDIEPRPCAACGFPMGKHPKPDYYPCPVTVVDGVGVLLAESLPQGDILDREPSLGRRGGLTVDGEMVVDQREIVLPPKPQIAIADECGIGDYRVPQKNVPSEPDTIFHPRKDTAG